MKNEKIRIVIKDWNSVVDDAIVDIKRNKATSTERIVYVKNIDVARKLLTPQRMRLLAVVRESKPDSLYALAKVMKKNIKTIITDTDLLCEFGLLTLESHKDGLQTKIRPHLEANKIQMEMVV